MRLKILTPERQVLDADVERVVADSNMGSFGVLDRHQPMVASLKIGVLQYVTQGERHSVAVMGGMFQTDGREALVLTNSAELAGEIDTLRAQQAKERAEALLRQQDSNVDAQRAEMALARAIARLKVAGKP
jgi:F-type H+-transporting ATPase subunit epsilon